MKRKIKSLRDHATERIQIGLIAALGLVSASFLLLGNMSVKPGNVAGIEARPVEFVAIDITNTEVPTPPKPQASTDFVRATDDNDASDILPRDNNDWIHIPAVDTGKIFDQGLPLPPPGATYPKLITKMDIKYPERLRAHRITGTVQVEAGLDEKGNVIYSKVLRSSGYSDFDQAAVEAVKTAKFSPALQNGIPMAVKIMVPVRFSMAE